MPLRLVHKQTRLAQSKSEHSMLPGSVSRVGYLRLGRLWHQLWEAVWDLSLGPNPTTTSPLVDWAWYHGREFLILPIHTRTLNIPLHDTATPLIILAWIKETTNILHGETVSIPISKSTELHLKIGHLKVQKSFQRMHHDPDQNKR